MSSKRPLSLSQRMSILLSEDGLRPLYRAIRQVETGGEANPWASNGAHGEIGPYQITLAFFEDAAGFYQDMPLVFEDCRGMRNAEMVMFVYFLRWEPNALYAEDYETLARLFHGGPNWKNREHTKDYWKKVKANL